MLNEQQSREALSKLKRSGWLDECHDLLAALPGSQREYIACAINPIRHDRLLKKQPLDLPEDLRQGSMSEHELAMRAGELLLRLGPEDRLRVFERLAPRNGWCLDAALEAVRLMPVGARHESLPFRAPGSHALNSARSLWLWQAVRDLAPFNATLPELVGFSSSLQRYNSPWAWIFAGAINAKHPESEAVLQALIDCINGRHPTGGITQDVIKALLYADRPEGWEAVEKLLLAAQRQEGVRQSILECVHEAHPAAFRRMCRLILEHDLCRFSSVARAVDVWLGIRWDSQSVQTIEQAIRSVLHFLENADNQQAVIDKGKPEEAYFALWAAAFDDLDAAIPLIQQLLAHKDPLKRYVGTHMLVMSGAKVASPMLIPMLRDEDLRVAARALDHFSFYLSTQTRNEPWHPQVFETIDGLLSRLSAKSTKLSSAIWPWTSRELSRDHVGLAMVHFAGPTQIARAIPHLKEFDPMVRLALGRALHNRYLQLQRERGVAPGQADACTQPAATEEIVLRTTFLRLLADGSTDVVVLASQSLCNDGVRDDELEVLVGVLKLKNQAKRTAAITRLRKLDDARLLHTARTLLDNKAVDVRVVGLELLQIMVEDKRLPQDARAVARAYVERPGKRLKTELQVLQKVLDENTTAPSRLDAFGLVNPANLAKPASPRVLPALRMSDAAWECLADVAVIIAENKARELPSSRASTDAEPILLGGDAGLSYTVNRPEAGHDMQTERGRCPIADLVDAWLTARKPETRDPDGLELFRASQGLSFLSLETGRWTSQHRPYWPEAIKARLQRESPQALAVLTQPMEFFLRWAMRLDGDRGYSRALLDSAEGMIAELAEHSNLPAPPVDLTGTQESDDDLESFEDKPLVPEKNPEPHVRLGTHVRTWINLRDEMIREGIIQDDPQDSIRVWRLAIAARPHAIAMSKKLSGKELERQTSYHDTISHLGIGIPIHHASVYHALAAGELTEDDLLDMASNPYWANRHGQIRSMIVSPLTQSLQDEEGWSQHARAQSRLGKRLRALPAFVAAAHRLRERLIDLELTRGDAATDASPMARAMTFAGGAEVCVRCLTALGKDALKRNGGWNLESRPAVLTHLVSVTLPNEGDTPEHFASLARSAGLSDATLITLAMLTPQWVRHVEHTLGKTWAGFEQAVWWIHAHTKDSEYRIDSSLREQWQAKIAEHTPIKPDQLKDGAVDVAWFERVIQTLGEKRWSDVYDAAKYACSGVGHKRAQLFADAMLSKRGATERELTARIKTKRHQDSIRALGLAPLKKGADGQKQVLTRYKLMNEIRRTSRKHGGAMLQASEKRAVEIGLENLARNAGYPDPLRLQWSMERVDLADLAKGPIKVKAGDVEVTLAVGEDGAPELTAVRKGKPLANVPPAAKKDKKVTLLAERVTELRRAASRVRASLEQAMCRGDVFTAREVTELLEHPVLKPMLQRLVLVGDATPSLAGYLDKGGKVLRDHAGAFEPLKAADVLRIAHPHDLLIRKDWTLWQRECFAVERVQPFKQVFRELYVTTSAERGAVEMKRYEGHQVNPRQALALLGGRGWVTRAEEGVQRTFYKERLTAHLTFAESFYTPAEVEGLTLQSASFAQAGEWKSLSLDSVPPRVFSETLRDLDLVVAVAHRGGVDPEASQSTIEMRAALARETAALLKLGNVLVDGTRLRIKGELAEYALHLGSASIQVLPGAHVWIIPVAAEHRGRLFLPFADSDPKTAEVLSKMLLLARDKEIRDPSILQQIRSLS